MKVSTLVIFGNVIKIDQIVLEKSKKISFSQIKVELYFDQKMQKINNPKDLVPAQVHPPTNGNKPH